MEMEMEMAFSLEEIIESFSVSSPVPTPLGILLQGGGGGGVGGEGGVINMNASEWCFEKLLEVVEGCNAPNSGASCSYVEANVCGSRGDLGRVGDHELGEMKAPVTPQPSNPVEFVHPGEHQALLKKKLDIVCAAVAMSWGSSVNTQDSASVADSRSPISDVTRPGSQVHTNVAQGRQATSNSSREQSDEDDELEGEAETNNIDPSDKRMRRMISNRESARRSRRRKQTHMSELEAQVSQLRIEHSSLLNHLTGINKKYSDASVNNRILKADLETVRAKVKMAEESLKRATGVNPLYPIMSSIDFPFTPSMSNPIPNMALPFQRGTNHFLHASMHLQDVVVPHGPAPVIQIGLTTSMQQAASPEQHQNPICTDLQWNAATRFPKTSVADE